MRLVCPECAAAYDVPDTMFGPQPRQVRCNRCGYHWSVIGAPVETAATTPVIEARPEPPAPAMVPPAPAPAPVPAPVVEPVAVAPPPLPPASPPPPMVEPMVEPVAEPVAEAIPEPAPALPPVQSSGSSRLADSLAGPRAPLLDETSGEVILPASTAASTRKLFGGVAAADPADMGPDPEERRLSAELDFGKPERYSREKSGSGRVVLVVIAIIIIVAVAAVIFKDNVVALVPSAEGLYAAVGLK
jgi:predicted Zn finger-like uncharacterized protein